VQAVRLTPGCPQVRTLLTYGQSSNPESVHSSDQTKRYSEKRWVRQPFCPGELEADRSAVRVHTAELGSITVTLREARGRPGHGFRRSATTSRVRPATRCRHPSTGSRWCIHTLGST
jgi:hypothetical protein